ncbi:MAG: DUF2167 domain-containing protein [Sphingomonadaceae bacterium]|nr:DUF2167 domain-containing protein [Sphingomonadaceae bacterium]
MIRLWVGAAALGAWAFCPAAADAVMQQVDALGWQAGGAPAQIGTVARFDLPRTVKFLGTADTAKFLTLSGNLSSADEYTVAKPDYAWFAIYHFDAVGKVDDQDKIDADALLKQLKQGDERENAERARMKLEPFHLVGWFVPPHYDAATHNLEWGTRLVDDHGHTTVNYTVRMLGRSGVMKAILVSDPAHLQHDVAEFRSVMTGFSFVPGERYSEWRNGDKVAGYGLAALVAGGAAAAAVKTGFFKTILVGLAAAWKIVAAAVVAGVAALRRTFTRLFGRSDR